MDKHYLEKAIQKYKAEVVEYQMLQVIINYMVENGNWSEVIIPSTDNFATKQEISDMLTKSEAASTYQPKGEYLTSIPEEYVTDSELSAKGYATTSQLSSKLDVSTYNSEKANFATKEELAAKADASALSAKQDTLVSGTNIKLSMEIHCQEKEILLFKVVELQILQCQILLKMLYRIK